VEGVGVSLCSPATMPGEPVNPLAEPPDLSELTGLSQAPATARRDAAVMELGNVAGWSA